MLRLRTGDLLGVLTLALLLNRMGLFGLRLLATVVSLEMVLLMRGLPARELLAPGLDVPAGWGEVAGAEVLLVLPEMGPVKKLS